MFLLKTEAAESKMESADDITAEATYVVSIKETKVGVRCCREMDRIRAASPHLYGDGELYVVWFQSEEQTQQKKILKYPQRYQIET